MQQLKGIRYQLFTIVMLEEFEGGGVCRSTPAELSRRWKPLENESNCARIRKGLIQDGWFIEVPGGIVTRKFEDTAKIAVIETTAGDELQKLQSQNENTAKIAVMEEKELQKLQCDTAKIAGTEIANKDLDFKEINILNTHINARARAESFPLNFLFFVFEEIELTSAQIGMIEAEVKNVDLDRLAWAETLQIYKANYNPERNRYMPEKVGNLLSVFKTERKKLVKKGEKQNAGSDSNNGKTKHGSQTDQQRNSRSGSERWNNRKGI